MRSLFLFYTFLREALFILYDIQCHFADPDGALAVLIYRHLLAIKICSVLQRLEEAVAVTSQYQVDIAGCGNHLGIIRAVYIPAQMRDADDDITLLLLFRISVISFAFWIGSRYWMQP